jgi:hypothetical protein
MLSVEQRGEEVTIYYQPNVANNQESAKEHGLRFTLATGSPQVRRHSELVPMVGGAQCTDTPIPSYAIENKKEQKKGLGCARCPLTQASHF